MIQFNITERGSAAVAALAVLAAPTVTLAQTTDRVLSEATIHEGDRCAIVGVGLNFPVRLVSSFPASFGDELRIRISPVDGGDMDGIRASRETLRPPSSRLAAISKIEFEGDRPEGPTLTITFERQTNFRLAQGSDFRSLVVAIAGDKPNPECLPTQQRPRDVTSVGAEPPLPSATPTATPDQAMSPADRALITQARAALTGGDYPRAIQVLTKLLQQPPGPASREGRELLAIARERNGQAAHAKAEYEAYLSQYPEGPDADRVRQRLAALIAGGGRRQEKPELAQGRGERKGAWKAGGSVAAYYMHDESYQEIDDTQSRTTTTETDTNLDQILSSLDTFAAYSSPSLRVKVRATGTYTNDFRPDGRDIGALSALYIEASDPRQRLYGRLGRQTRSTGGVLGRFDGALVSTKVTSTLKLEAVAGAPVDSPKDVSIDKDRYFYGASLVFGRFANAWDGDVYAIQQKSSGLVDRRAVGAELRYVENGRSVFGAVDYDVYFDTLNFAIVNGSWNYGDGGAFTFALDYRRSPLLLTDNAAIGQTVFSLDALQGLYSEKELRQLALDRSAPSRSATLGVSQPLTEKLTFNTDATITSLDSTPESGGVPGAPASGTEYFYSAQLIGSSLFKEGDIGILGLRYADTATSNRWMVDVNTRYPWSRALRINPRLRVGYRTGKTNDTTELSARPSIRLNFVTRHHLQFEPEFGGEWLRADTPTGQETTTGYFVNFGIRRDF
jgi:hypothetical protein